MLNKKKQITDCRRQRHDRRQADQGPPSGWNDRRRSVERRLPEVQEDFVSYEVWSEYFSRYVANLTGSTQSKIAAAKAAFAAMPGNPANGENGGK